MENLNFNYNNDSYHQALSYINFSSSTDCIYIDENMKVHRAGIFRQIFEKLKGWCGGLDQTKADVLGNRLFKFVEIGKENRWIDATKAHQVATRIIGDSINLGTLFDTKDFTSKESNAVKKTSSVAAVQENLISQQPIVPIFAYQGENTPQEILKQKYPHALHLQIKGYSSEIDDKINELKAKGQSPIVFYFRRFDERYDDWSSLAFQVQSFYEKAEGNFVSVFCAKENDKISSDTPKKDLMDAYFPKKGPLITDNYLSYRIKETYNKGLIVVDSEKLLKEIEERFLKKST